MRRGARCRERCFAPRLGSARFALGAALKGKRDGFALCWPKHPESEQTALLSNARQTNRLQTVGQEGRKFFILLKCLARAVRDTVPSGLSNGRSFVHIPGVSATNEGGGRCIAWWVHAFGLVPDGCAGACSVAAARTRDAMPRGTPCRNRSAGCVRFDRSSGSPRRKSVCAARIIRGEKRRKQLEPSRWGRIWAST